MKGPENLNKMLFKLKVKRRWKDLKCKNKSVYEALHLTPVYFMGS